MIEGLEVQAQIEIVDKCVLLVSDVHESGIERGKYFLDFSKIDISHTVATALRFLPIEFNQTLVLQECNRDFGLSYINNQIFVHTCKTKII